MKFWERHYRGEADWIRCPRQVQKAEREMSIAQLDNRAGNAAPLSPVPTVTVKQGDENV